MTQLSRSDFVKLGSLFTGSLVLGVDLTGCSNESATAPAGTPAAAPFKPNQWLTVNPDESVIVVVAKSEMGQGIATGVSTIVADELDLPWKNVRVEFAPANGALYGDKNFGGAMLTGGSESMAASWLPMRTAGAAAREMLVAAAAKGWNVDPASCTTKDGSVLHAGSNRSATYGSLVAAAAQIPAPSKPKLKRPDQYTLIGKTFPRYDAPAKINGSARFGIDVRVPGMKFASIAYSPVFGGSVKSFDATKAKTVANVLDAVKVSRGVAVVATNSWAAFQGKKALEIVWDEGPNAQLDDAKMFAIDEALAASRKGAVVPLHQGDVTAVTGHALEAVYKGPWLAHAAMEPMNATASVTKDGVEIWAPNQTQTAGQAAAAKITGLPLDKVQVHTTYLGGGFGRRLYTDYMTDAVEVSQAIGAPVQVIWTREDDTQHDWYKPMAVNAIRGVLSSGGELLALDHTVVMGSIIRPLLPSAFKDGLDTISMDGVMNTPYAPGIPNVRASYIDSEHGIPVGSLRAPGANWNYFVVESFIDELAHAAGKDPVAFRMALLHKTPRAAFVLKEVAEKAGWGSPKTPGAKQGLAVVSWNGTYAALVAEVTMVDKQPKVHRAVIVADLGQVVNPDVVSAQLQSGIIYGLSAALTGKITIKNGRVEQHNFYDFTVLRLAGAPAIETYTVPSTAAPTGIGEVGTPPIAPAVANAVFALTGKRVRSLPFKDALAESA